MKLLKMRNGQGIERYYSRFYMELTFFEATGSIDYDIMGVFWNTEQCYPYEDVIQTVSDLETAVSVLTDLTKKLNDQQCYPCDVYYQQCERGVLE